MELSPVIAELITERIKDSLTLRLGETFAARVLEVRDRMLLLKLEGGTVIQTRLIADLDFKRGQDIVLQVKGIGEGRIVLAVAGPEGDRISQIESFNVEAGTRAALEDTGIIVKMVENGLPVTPNNTETIQRAIKHICYLLDKAVLSAEHLPPVDIDLVNAPLGELVKWLIGAGEGTPINRPAADGNQKLSLLMAELPGVEAEDVIKLTKHGMRISLANIVLAKNLRENKGFPDILLKLLFKQAGLKEERADEGASKARHPLSRTGGDEHPVERGANEANKRMEGKRPTVEPVDIKLLLESIKTAGKARPYQRAAAELLAQRTVLLEEALAGQTFSIFTFLFRQEPCGCIIRSDRNRGGGEDGQDDFLELEMETKAPNLGSIKIHMILREKDLECDFFVESIDTKRLIDRKKEILSDGLKRTGFRVSRIDCRKKPERKPKTSDKVIDLRV